MATETRTGQGLATLHKIAGDQAAKPLGDWNAIDPEMREWIVAFVAGDVLSRPGLDLKIRQFATVAMVAALGDAPDEFRMHLAGALSVSDGPDLKWSSCCCRSLLSLASRAP